MPQEPRRPVLHLIACGAEPAADLEPFVKTCQEQGWDVWLVATPSALKYLDKGALAELTGHAVCVDHTRLDEPSPLPPPGALAVVPASFNAVNKLAYGGCGTFLLRLVTESIGLGLPILAMPAPSEALARHPAFLESIARLRAWGAVVLFDRYGYPGAAAHDDEQARELPWRTAENVLAGWIRFARLPPPGVNPPSGVDLPPGEDDGPDMGFPDYADDRQRDPVMAHSGGSGADWRSGAPARPPSDLAPQPARRPRNRRMVGRGA